jgi:hypothetical protein
VDVGRPIDPGGRGPAPPAAVDAGGPTGVVLVEGQSDRAALDALARRQGRRLDREGVVVIAVGGAGGMARHLLRLGPRGADLRLAGLYDRGEAPVVRRALARAGVDRRSFFCCDADLEDELIRALGPERILALLDGHGDLRAFRTLQRQPAWRGRPVDAQLRRFFGAGARRKTRYARILVEAAELDRLPDPLIGVLAAV